jgi:hypothetical protein
MRSVYLAAVLVALTSTPVAGCGGADGPLGGPHDGTESTIAPTPGNVNDVPVEDGDDGGTSGADGGTSSSGPALTFAQIFSKYLASGTPGNCTECHAQMSNASTSYGWLVGQGYVQGASSLLVHPGSCLSWYGGTMPPGGSPSDPQAVSDMNAWAAAGAPNN